MKKMKTLVTSLLCVTMLGSIGLTAGCGKGGNGGESGDGFPDATVAEKQTFYTAFNASLGEIMTSGKAYKIGVKADVETIISTGGEAMSSGETVTGGTQKVSASVDGAAYFQYVEAEEKLSVDATISANATVGATGGVIGAAAYVRDNLVYFGATEEEDGTEVDFTTLSYQYIDVEPMLQEILGEMQNEIDSSQISSEQLEAINGLMAYYQKVYTSMLMGLHTTIKTEGNKSTLTWDAVQEVNAIIKAMGDVIAAIKPGMTVSQLLADKSIKNLWNRFYGNVTADDLYQVIQGLAEFGGEEMGGMTAMFTKPTTGQTSYEYIIGIILKLPADETGASIGATQIPNDSSIANLKAQFDAAVAEQVTPVLSAMKSLKFMVNLTNNKFSGIAVDVDVDGKNLEEIGTDVDVEAEITFGEATYSFIDVTTLDATEYVPPVTCDWCYDEVEEVISLEGYGDVCQDCYDYLTSEGGDDPLVCSSCSQTVPVLISGKCASCYTGEMETDGTCDWCKQVADNVDYYNGYGEVCPNCYDIWVAPPALDGVCDVCQNPDNEVQVYDSFEICDACMAE